jgi:hypothetical protein
MNITVFKNIMQCRLADTIGTVQWLSTVADFNPSVYRVLVYVAHTDGHFLLASLLNQNRLTQEAG